MKRFSKLWLGVGLFLAGCGPQVAEAPKNPSTAPAVTEVSSKIPVSPDGEFLLGDGITHANLTVFPILSKTQRSQDRLLTLDEGLAKGTVEVRELGAARNYRSANGSGNAPAAQALDPNDPFGAPAPAPAPGPAPASGCQDPPANEETPPQAAPINPFDPFAEPPGATPRAADSSDDSEFDQRLLPGNGRAERFFGNSVNRVVVVNKSDRPLYLMPGEIILGGDQDRTIGRELVIAPTGEPVEIDVYCVEHGRWGGKGAEVTLAQLAALNEHSITAQSWSSNVATREHVADEQTATSTPLSKVATIGGRRGSVEERPANLALEVELKEKAAEADQGKFVASAGALSKSGRVAAQHDKDQGKVWEEVAEANAKGKVAIRSGAFTGQYVEADAKKRLDPYLEHLTKEISEQPNVVGVVVAIDGRVESFDVFESTPLFRKLWPKLLKSFAVDAANAIDSRDPEEKAPPACSQQVAATFVKEAIAAEATSQEESHGLSIAKTDTDKVLLFSAHDPSQRPFVTSVVPSVEGESAPAAIGGAGGSFGGGGAFGGSVHGFGAAK